MLLPLNLLVYGCRPEIAKRQTFMAAVIESNTSHQSNNQQQEVCDPCKSFCQKCSHLVKKQRAKFYILRRCVAMLLCWHERGDQHWAFSIEGLFGSTVFFLCVIIWFVTQKDSVVILEIVIFFFWLRSLVM